MAAWRGTAWFRSCVRDTVRAGIETAIDFTSDDQLRTATAVANSIIQMRIYVGSDSVDGGTTPNGLKGGMETKRRLPSDVLIFMSALTV